MTPGKQQQQLVLSLAQWGGVFRCLLHLPDAQTELEPLRGGFLRKTGGKPELPDVGTNHYRAV
ncbi:hypothetical protein HA42_09900 [Pantoea deleyi]|nr:hypothetical protein HA42_09900 [Pantoea deleyi]